MSNTTGNDGAADAPRPDGDRSGGASGTGAGRAPILARAGLAALGVLLVAAGWFLPLWTATLHAPQYPGGLVTIAYGSKVTGDLNEINALNHYVGLGVFDPSELPEMRFWPLAVVLALIAVVVAAVAGRGWSRRSALAYLWGMPVGVLAVIQFRLHEFGQDVEPGAAFRMEPFTPWVVGRTTVWNFETWSWPGLGLLALVVAAAAVTFVPRWFDRRRRGATPSTGDGSGAEGGGDRGRATAVALLVVILAASGTGLTAGSAEAAEHGSHDHGTHDDGGPRDQRGGPTDLDRAPTIGPDWHPAMPTIVEHPPAGDLASLLAEVEPGGTLRLEAGTYTGPVVIEEPITIEGQGYPIVQGDGTGSVITIRAPGTVVRGLVVQRSGPGPVDGPAGIRVEADDVVIEGNVVQDSYMGLAVDSAASVKLIDNHVHGRFDAPLADDGHAVEHEADDGDATPQDPHAAHDAHDHDAHGHDAHDHDEHDHEAHDHDAHDHDAHDHDAHGHDAHDHDAHDDHGAHGGHGDHAGQGTPSSVPGAARGDGIWLHDVDHALVRGNHIMGARDGVYVSFGSGTLIDSNHIHGSRYAFHTMFARDLTLVQNHVEGNLSGAVLMYGEGALLLRNHIERNVSTSTGFGAILKDITAVEAVENLFVDNRIAVHLDGPTEATFTANTFARSDVGLQAHSSATATFAGNSFVQNAIQVRPLGPSLDGMAWTDRGFGNYWDTYRGYDEHGEGLGAVPHVEGGAVDRLLARSPELIAIADTPAMRLLRSVEERWGQRVPALVDPAPLTRPISPAVPAAVTGAPAPIAAAVLAVALLLPALVLLIRPRRRRTASGRFARVVNA